MTNTNFPHPDSEKDRGPCAFLPTRVSTGRTGSQSHNAQERVIREKLIEPLALQLDEERHVIHDK